MVALKAMKLNVWKLKANGFAPEVFEEIISLQ